MVAPDSIIRFDKTKAAEAVEGLPKGLKMIAAYLRPAAERCVR